MYWLTGVSQLNACAHVLKTLLLGTVMLSFVLFYDLVAENVYQATKVETCATTNV